MESGAKILQKLIEDFKALTYTGGSSNLFSDVASSYLTETRNPSQGLLLYDDDTEFIRGNNMTDRNYGFYFHDFEEINNKSLTDADVQNMYYRLANKRDVLLNYLQREPSNLRAWGQLQTPIISIFKNRVNQVLFDVGKSQNGGYAATMELRFTVFQSIDVKLIPELP